MDYYIFFTYKKSNNKNVFDQTTLKNLKLKNRIFLGAEFDDSFKDGKFSEKGLKKYENLAKNGVSLMITGAALVGDYFPSPLLRIDRDEYISEFKKLVDIVHKHNTYILLQLIHAGLFSPLDEIYSQVEISL